MPKEPVDGRSPTQQYIDKFGSLAKSPLPAYSLASLFALSAPFSLAGGRDLQRVPVPTESPQSPLQHISRSLTKSPSTVTLHPKGLPPFWQLAGFAAVFAGGGYIIDSGDILNGSGTVTGR